MNESPSYEDNLLPVRSEIDPCEQGREMAEELKDIAGWLAGGGSTPEQFARAVCEFERRKLTRLGFTLSSAVSEGPIVHFSLRVAESGELCASMDVNPETGDIDMQFACA